VQLQLIAPYPVANRENPQSSALAADDRTAAPPGSRIGYPSTPAA